MPQDGSNNYYYPPSTPGVSDTPIKSMDYNAFIDDLKINDLNIPRPIHRGGTGAQNAHDAMVALGGEIATQIVTNYASFPFVAGSFYSAGGATDAPSATGFSGICIATPDPGYMTLEGREITGAGLGRIFARQKSAGVWGAWTEQSGSSADLDARYVNVTGDTMTGDLSIVKNGPVFTLNQQNVAGGSWIQNLVGGNPRWKMFFGEGAVEGGGNSGTNFLIQCFNDAGTFIANALYGIRGTGLLTVAGNPTDPLGIATKQYADLKVAKTGDTMTGVLNIIPATGGAYFYLAPAQAAQQAVIGFFQSGVAKWQIGKQGDDSFFLYNASLGNYGFLLSPTTSLITVAGDPAAPLGIATKQYADTKVAKTGDTMTGPLTVGGNFTMLGSYNKIQSPGDWAGFSAYNATYALGLGWFGISDTMYFGRADINGAATAAWRFNMGPNSCELYGAGGAWKPGGGPWDSSSDARIKNVLGEYKNGLASILTLNPVRYTYKGNDVPAGEPDLPLDADGKAQNDNATAPYKRSPHRDAAELNKHFIGLIAQECENEFPEIISRRPGTIDGQLVTDIRGIDAGPLLFALINAVKELAAKVEMLEGK